jgi:hypothetical protein
MTIDFNINNLFPGFLEGLISIIVFYTIYLIYIGYGYLPFIKILFEKHFEEQIKLYPLCDLSSRNPKTSVDIIKDKIILEKENEEYNKIYDDFETQKNENNKNSLSNLYIIYSLIIGGLIIISIIILYFKYYDYKEINFMGLLFAGILHTIFIILLQYVFLYLIISNYYTTIMVFDIFKN